MINSLTDEEVKLMEVVKNDWLSILFGKRKRINREKAKELIGWLYEFSGLQKPLIIFLESPLGLQYAQNILRGMDLSQVRSQVEFQVRSQVRSQVWSQVGSQVWSQVESQVWSQVESQVGSQVKSQVRSQVWSQVESQVRSQVWSEKLVYEFFSSYGNIWDLGWLSFYDFFEKIGFNYNNQAYDKFKQLIKLRIYDMIQMDKVCFVASLPKDLYRDELNRLHSSKTHAISWRDGYKLYYLYGVNFEKPLWTKIVKRKITPKELLSLTNIEQRIAGLKVIGIENILEEANAKLLDHVKGYELYQLDGVFRQPAYYLKYKDTSTNRIYCSGIDPRVGAEKDAVKALAWKFSIDDYEKDKPFWDQES